MKLLNHSDRILLNLFLLFIFSASVAFPQTAESSNAKKLKDIKGEAKKITITTSEGTTVFEGKEAEWLLQKMKEDPLKKKIKVHLNDDDFEDIGKLRDFDIDIDIPDHDIILKRFLDDDSSKTTKKIIVNIENGDKKVTVTETGKDGKIKTETYTGKEADEYLKQHEAEVEVYKDKSNDKKKIEKKKIIIIEK